jgi:hypothetical protein
MLLRFGKIEEIAARRQREHCTRNFREAICSAMMEPHPIFQAGTEIPERLCHGLPIKRSIATFDWFIPLKTCRGIVRGQPMGTDATVPGLRRHFEEASEPADVDGLPRLDWQR